MDLEEVERPNLYVKIPATMAGLPAIEDAIAHGVPINITLIFGLDRYKAVVEAYLRGLERLIAGGGDATKVNSVASFFVSRVDSEADKRLEALGNKKLQGKLAIANAKLRTSTSSTRSKDPAGTTLRARVRACSGRSGRPRRRRTRRTATSCTSKS